MKVTKLIKTLLKSVDYACLCDDCEEVIPADMPLVIAYRISTGPRKGFTLTLHRECARDLGGDLAGELTRV